MSEEQRRRVMSEESKAKIKETALAKKAACKVVHDFIDGGGARSLFYEGLQDDFADTLMEALKVATNYKPARPQGSRKGSRRDKLEAIRAALIEKGSLSEIDLFLKFKVGQAEMRWVRGQLATNYPDSDKIFIELVDECWTIVGLGENNAPEGFNLRTGPVRTL